MTTKPAPGIFIVVEGVDGAGKTTQVDRVEQWARANGREVVRVREPGGTPLGERLRTVFLECKKDSTSTVVADILMLVAAKHQLYHEVIQPALQAGKVVIADRWSDTLYAYQQGGFGAPDGMVTGVLHATRMLIYPDLVLYLDVSPTTAALRTKRRAGDRNALDDFPVAFFKRVRTVYRQRANSYDHIRLINADRPIEAVTKSIFRILDAKFPTADLLVA